MFFFLLLAMKHWHRHENQTHTDMCRISHTHSIWNSLLQRLLVNLWFEWLMSFWLQVDHHDAENSSLLRFNALWEASYRHDSLLVFSTGRSPLLYKQLRKEKPMITPDITIMSVGTEITYGKSMVPDDGWVQVLNQKWDKDIVIEEASKFPELKPQVFWVVIHCDLIGYCFLWTMVQELASTFTYLIVTLLVWAAMASIKWFDSYFEWSVLQAETEQRAHKVSFYVEKDNAKQVTEALSKILEQRGVSYNALISILLRNDFVQIMCIYVGFSDVLLCMWNIVCSSITLRNFWPVGCENNIQWRSWFGYITTRCWQRSSSCLFA